MPKNQSPVIRTVRKIALAAMVWPLATVCFLATPPRYALAQADVGRIAGTVTDNTGAVIPGAKVTATRVETNAAVSVQSNKEGDYVFPSLQTGHYQITVELKGFASETKQGYELDDNSAITVNFSMQAGESEQVIVTTQVGDTVNTQTGEVSHVIDGETVRDLALNGRNYLDLLGILPGSVVTNGGDALATITTGSTTGIVLNGVRATANGLYIDGVINKDIGSNANQFNNVGIDFIEHVKVETSAFSAQFGSAAGPAVNVVTRSGTNSLHGSAFELVRNDLLDASNYFLKTATNQAIRQHLRFNDFGAALGGPIFKDKLFFFAGTEWKLIAQNSNPATVTLPFVPFLQGHFLQSSATSTGVPTTPCPIGSVPSRGVLINAATCDISSLITPFGHAFANTYLNLIKQATSYTGNDCTLNGCTSPNGNSVYSLPNPFRNHEYLARIDWNISKRQNMYGRWIADTHTTTNPLGDGSLPTTQYHDEGPANNLVISHTLTVSPTSFNEISVAGLWSSINQQPYGTNWLKSSYGYNYTPLYLGAGPKLGIPQVSLYGYTGFDGDQFLNISHTTVITLQDVFTKVAGKQSIKIGGLYGRNRKDQNGKPYYNGTVSFTNASSSLYTTGNAIADALLGNFQQYTESAADTYGLFRLSQAAAFVDDTWRILPKLSLSLGARYEWLTPWSSEANNLASFYPQFYDPSQAVTVKADGTVTAGSGNILNGMRRAGDGVPQSQQARVSNANSPSVLSVPTIGKRGFYKAQHVLAPRFGFAYDLFGNGYTSFRGGMGLFFDTPQGNVAFTALNAPPYLQTISVANGNMDNLAQYAGQAATNTNGDMFAVSSLEERPTVTQYNFGIQQQLDKGMFLQINYVGNEQHHLLHSPDINGVDPGVEDAAFAVNQSVNINSLRPYKGYGAIYQYRTDGDANYNALQANINRRVGKGRFTFAYTWSKALATASEDGAVAHVFPFSKTYYYGYASFDRRHLYTASYIFTAPTFRGHNMFVRAGLGDWQLTGTARFQGGTRLTPTATDTLGVAQNAEYAGLPVIYNHTQVSWFDTLNPGNLANLYAPNPGQIGNVPIGLISGPSYKDVSVSARKTFNYSERYHLTVNLDAFNAFNHPNFGNPSVNVNSAATISDPGLVTSTNTGGHNYAYLGIGSANRPRNVQAGLRFTF